MHQNWHAPFRKLSVESAFPPRPRCADALYMLTCLGRPDTHVCCYLRIWTWLWMRRSGRGWECHGSPTTLQPCTSSLLRYLSVVVFEGEISRFSILKFVEYGRLLLSACLWSTATCHLSQMISHQSPEYQKWYNKSQSVLALNLRIMDVMLVEEIQMAMGMLMILRRSIGKIECNYYYLTHSDSHVNNLKSTETTWEYSSKKVSQELLHLICWKGIREFVRLGGQQTGV